LLVVIGILVLLLAMLLPAYAGARRQARVVHCASNLRQICAALHTYAMENKGQLPDLTRPGTGGNVWDVSHFFCAASQQLGLSYLTFLCPASQVDPSVAQAEFNNYPDFNIIQYNIWIPRKNGADIIPPAPNYSGTRFLIMQPTPASPFAGPANAFDTTVAGNPIITDIVGTKGAITPPANADASAPGMHIKSQATPIIWTANNLPASTPGTWMATSNFTVATRCIPTTAGPGGIGGNSPRKRQSEQVQ